MFSRIREHVCLSLLLFCAAVAGCSGNASDPTSNERTQTSRSIVVPQQSVQEGPSDEEIRLAIGEATLKSVLFNDAPLPRIAVELDHVEITQSDTVSHGDGNHYLIKAKVTVVITLDTGEIVEAISNSDSDDLEKAFAIQKLYRRTIYVGKPLKKGDIYLYLVDADFKKGPDGYEIVEGGAELASTNRVASRRRDSNKQAEALSPDQRNSEQTLAPAILKPEGRPAIEPPMLLAAPAEKPVEATIPSAASSPSETDHCDADAPGPQAPEEFTLLANGRRHLTGRRLRIGVRGEVFVVEAALGYDGMCRPSPYQIYVFNRGIQVGTLSPKAMIARSDGAIVSFSERDSEHLEVEMAHYTSDDPLCCPSSHEQLIVPLSQFGIGQTVTDARGVSASILDDGSNHVSERSAPSFDCAKASNDVEHAICSSPELSEIDSEMGRAYGDLVRALDPSGRTELKSEQREWIIRRQHECGGDVPCLNIFLHSRLDDLNDRTRRSNQL